MKGLLITSKGEERVASQEIKELIESGTKEIENGVEFTFNDYEEVFKLCYFSQSAHRIIVLDNVSEWLKEGMSFRVRCEESSKEREVGKEINKENKFKVDLENPDVPFYEFKGYVGVDFTGDISKRSFRIFTHRNTIKGTTAYCILREAGYTGKEVLLDPFCKDGTIVMEAVHASKGRSVRYHDVDDLPFTYFDKFSDYDFDEFFDKFKERESSKVYAFSSDVRDVNAVKKNAKIAGVKDSLTFSRQDVDWLDTKFGKEEVDLVVSYIPAIPEKLWEDFCHMVHFISKKMVLLSDVDLPSNKYFELEREKEILVGKSYKPIKFFRKKDL